jgi:NarL family two-component system response regulator LiaR
MMGPNEVEARGLDVGEIGQGDLRVLLIDDHDLFRTGLRSLLEDAGFSVRDAPGAEAGLALCRSYHPHVVLMDMQMPAMSGIEGTRCLLEIHPEAVVLMLTVAADHDGVLAAIRAGASGYLLKEARLAEIVASVNAAAEGRSPISPRVAGALVDSVRRRAPVLPSGADIASLTERERAVLALLADGHENNEIAARLFVSASTVKNHVSRVLEKIGVENRVQAAAFAIRHGLDSGYASAVERSR